MLLAQDTAWTYLMWLSYLALALPSVTGLFSSARLLSEVVGEGMALCNKCQLSGVPGALNTYIVSAAVLMCCHAIALFCFVML